MLKSKKSHLTCSYCSRIFKDPSLLPCHDSICREHLKERDIVIVKCKECNEEYGVKNNDFKPNEALTQLLESESYLSEDEIALKQ
jgi:hypothetical protein